MSDENNESSLPPDGEESNENTEAPRPKTPLELVRERQAKLRGEKPTPGRSSREGGASGPADSYKRRQHQRKSG